MDNFEKIEEEAVRKTAPKKPKMKISGKSNFLLARVSAGKSLLTRCKKIKPKEK